MARCSTCVRLLETAEKQSNAGKLAAGLLIVVIPVGLIILARSRKGS